MPRLIEGIGPIRGVGGVDKLLALMQGKGTYNVVLAANVTLEGEWREYFERLDKHAREVTGELIHIHVSTLDQARALETIEEQFLRLKASIPGEIQQALHAETPPD